MVLNGHTLPTSYASLSKALNMLYLFWSSLNVISESLGAYKERKPKQRLMSVNVYNKKFINRDFLLFLLCGIISCKVRRLKIILTGINTCFRI